MGFLEDLGAGPVALDTSIFIYFIEQRQPFLELLRNLFVDADCGLREFVTSALTLLEVLVVPHRNGDRLLADRYEALMKRSRGLTVVDITSEQLWAAAQIRARTAAKTPDAIQLAAALTYRCTTLVTNDRAFPNVSALRVLQLGAYCP